jgi:hypothetical protein
MCNHKGSSGNTDNKIGSSGNTCNEMSSYENKYKKLVPLAIRAIK